MKKLRVLALAFVMTAAVSCSSDSDSGPAPTIVAKWNLSKTVTTIAGASNTDTYADNEVGCDKDYVEFVQGGNFRNIVFNKDPQNNCTEVGDDAATWALTNSTNLTITGGEFADTYTVIKLSGSELTTKATSTIGGTEASVTYYFKKATTN
ncbi:MAG: hypothetical protein CFE23_14090 [Flavobacterium sp. BFFFF1]|uniref:lipocalin family protein n=1 Tax=unclassified Flavobacterium TaxID=196869 RepID=UPI000BC93F8A|nr:MULTISPECIES: lipocalin family protein [unclassified Flavobacterium]OYU79426.1 MAG: hypothetical protein CFE23_14090 [Flavobacterium sp. BFFFF1]